MFDIDLRPLVWLAGFGLFVGVPLMLWQIVKIIWWLYEHVAIVW